MGVDTFDGGDGSDTLSYTWFWGGLDVNLATGELRDVGSPTAAEHFASIENVATGTGDDILRGSDGSNHMQGGDGNDQIFGGAGDDWLEGGAGTDRLSGDTGNDRLAGGAGDDTFVFASNFGQDVITDFSAGPGPGDVIEAHGLWHDFADVMSHAVETQHTTGGVTTVDVVITFDTDPTSTSDPLDTLTLQGVTLASLRADDFVFV